MAFIVIGTILGLMMSLAIWRSPEVAEPGILIPFVMTLLAIFTVGFARWRQKKAKT